MKRITRDKHRKGLGKSRVDVCRSGRRFCFSEFNYKDARHRAKKWNVGLERRKEREMFRGRLRKRTPFLRWRAQLKRIRDKNTNKPLRINQHADIIRAKKST